MSILIGLHVVQTLLNNEVVAEKVGDRIFPLVVPQGVERFPFVVYDMQGGSGTTTKDGSVDDAVTVQVNADVSYPVTIRAIRPGADDENLPISQY